jgi:fucokinase
MNWLVVTAANRAQAHGYEIQLRSRTFENLRWLVIPDPRGHRVGSGGSTLWVLNHLSKIFRKTKRSVRRIQDLFAGERILILHSGGDSRRLLSYAAQGKLFTPLPCSTADGSPATLFDLIVNNLLSFPSPARGQVLIASGDVLLTFDPEDVCFEKPGVVGVAYPGPIERGARHGVYVAGRDGIVTDFLQKPDEETARNRKAVDAADRVLVDTGLISLDPATVEKWLGCPSFLRSLASGTSGTVDLYDHLLISLISRGKQSSSSLPRELFKAIHGAQFHVNILPCCDFFHVGSTHELIANIGILNRTAKHHGFANFERAFVASRASMEGAFVYNCVLTSEDISAGDGVFMEAVHTSHPVSLPGRNVVVNWPPDAREPLKLKPGECVVCLPIGRDKWTTLRFDIDDNFKTTPSRWDDKLYVINQRPSLFAPSRPSSSKRYSLRQLMPLVNHNRLLTQRKEIQRIAELKDLGHQLNADRWYPATRILSLIRSRAEARKAIASIQKISNADALTQTRLFKYISLLELHFGSRCKSSFWEKSSFDAISRSVAQNIEIPDEPRRAAILHDQVVWVTAPARIDFAGGWSDTPPICTEIGGTVLNAAITLNGQYPIQVMAKLTERQTIKLNSLDLGERVEITQTPQIEEYRDPSRWYALPKAALMLGGAVPGDPRISLRNWLQRIGGGLDITVFSALPKGSGLGTSSILGASMLACLARVLGEALTQDKLIARTSLLEQVMTTAGGWQDQIGGIVPGVKLIRTDPGPSQIPRIQWTPFDMSPTSEMASRLLLYYTGQKRMAKNILQKVVNRWLAREPEVISIINKLKDLAESLERSLGAANVDDFGRGIGQYWELKKRLDNGATSPAIDSLFYPIERYLTGKLLPGAGGGGFVFMVARDVLSASKVRSYLIQNRPDCQSRLFEFGTDHKGLAVMVL